LTSGFISVTVSANLSKRVYSMRNILRILGVGIIIAGFVYATDVNAYMPPPDSCELAPVTYGPPPCPAVAPAPPPPYCGPCPPIRIYPKKVAGAFPKSIVCRVIAPTPAAYKCAPPMPCPPPCAPACPPKVCR
jgi:hypothetical protein